jgi:hypothetical protein
VASCPAARDGGDEGDLVSRLQNGAGLYELLVDGHSQGAEALAKPGMVLSQGYKKGLDRGPFRHLDLQPLSSNGIFCPGKGEDLNLHDLLLLKRRDLVSN